MTASDRGTGLMRGRGVKLTMLLLAASILLTGCGRKGPLEEPPGSQPNAPREQQDNNA